MMNQERAYGSGRKLIEYTAPVIILEEEKITTALANVCSFLYVTLNLTKE